MRHKQWVMWMIKNQIKKKKTKLKWWRNKTTSNGTGKKESYPSALHTDDGFLSPPVVVLVLADKGDTLLWLGRYIVLNEPQAVQVFFGANIYSLYWFLRWLRTHWPTGAAPPSAHQASGKEAGWCWRQRGQSADRTMDKTVAEEK